MEIEFTYVQNKLLNICEFRFPQAQIGFAHMWTRFTNIYVNSVVQEEIDIAICDVCIKWVYTRSKIMFEGVCELSELSSHKFRKRICTYVNSIHICLSELSSRTRKNRSCTYVTRFTYVCVNWVHIRTKSIFECI